MTITTLTTYSLELTLGTEVQVIRTLPEHMWLAYGYLMCFAQSVSPQ